MIRRLFRVLVAGACLLSLLLCLGAGWLWWKSYRTPPRGELHASVFVARRHTRYTVRSDRGRLTLYRPPTGLKGAAGIGNDPAAQQWVGQLSDDQVLWRVSRVWASDRPPVYRAVVLGEPGSGTPLDGLVERMRGPRNSRVGAWWMAGKDDLTGRLLGAMDEPGRSLAAYVALRGSMSFRLSDPALSRLDPFPDGSVPARLGTLPVLLRPNPPFSPDPHAGGGMETRTCSAHVDPAAFADLRDRCHRGLDDPVVSVPHGRLVAAFAVPPLVWLATAGRRILARRRWVRTGRCEACGNDLTGNVTGVCPECGRVTLLITKQIRGQ